MLSLLVSFLIACIILALFWWILTLIPLPPPLQQIIRVVFIVIACFALIYFLYDVAVSFGGVHPLLR